MSEQLNVPILVKKEGILERWSEEVEFGIGFEGCIGSGAARTSRAKGSCVGCGLGGRPYGLVYDDDG